MAVLPRGSAQLTYKMCSEWKVVQAHTLKYQHHLQFLILLFSTASNYRYCMRTRCASLKRKWTYVMHNYFKRTWRLACPNTDNTTAIQRWEWLSLPSPLQWAASCQPAVCYWLLPAWCSERSRCCCCWSWHYYSLASYFHYLHEDWSQASLQNHSPTSSLSLQNQTNLSGKSEFPMSL